MMLIITVAMSYLFTGQQFPVLGVDELCLLLRLNQCLL